MFTRITTYMLTEPLKRLFASKAPTTSLPLPSLRLLPGGTNQFPGGSVPRWKAAAFTAHNQSFPKRELFLAAIESELGKLSIRTEASFSRSVSEMNADNSYR